MPTLKYRDTADGLYKEAGFTVNEVAVSATQPTDGSKLWLDTASTGTAYVKASGDTMTGNLTIKDLVIGENADSYVYMSGRPENSSATSKIYFGANGMGSIQMWPAASGSTMLFGGIGTDGLYVGPDDMAVVTKEPTSASHIPTKKYADSNAGSLMTWTAASGWTDFASGYGGLWATRVGQLCTVQGVLKRTGTNLAVAANAATTVSAASTLTTNFKPPTNTLGYTDCYSGTAHSLGIVEVSTSGTLSVTCASAVTFTQNTGYVIINITYRVAPI